MHTHTFFKKILPNKGFLKRIFSFESRALYSIGLFLIVLFIAWKNLPSGSEWLTGWDNLHPEFNFPLNISRAINGVWQQHQGLGHIGGHGYAATLPHTLFLWVLSIIIPISKLRYVFTVLMLLVGTYGTFFLTSHLLRSYEKKMRYIFSFTGALFYMLNFATVQQFYTQLEAFIIHFAALPWLVYSLLLIFDKPSKKRLLLFFLLNVVFSTQGFIPPLFIAYSVIVCIILLIYLAEKRNRYAVKKTIVVCLLMLFANAYWLLPVIQFTLTDNHVYLNSYNNLLSTESWSDTNNLYGTIEHLSILRGFPSQAVDTVINGTKIYIFQPWLDYLAKQPIRFIGSALFTLMVFGILVFSYTKAKYERGKKHELGLVIAGIVFFAILAASTPILSSVSRLLQEMPLFKQAFRAGFTKLSISLALVYSTGISYGLLGTWLLIHKYLQKQLENNIIIVTTLLVSACIVVFSFPIFKGDLFYEKLKLTIPQGYFQMFDYFSSKDPNGRIMTLPQGEHWGWYYYKWGYTGSGFVWFGLKQPVLERAFDVWNNYNENYYWESSYALYSQDANILRDVITKYNVRWIVFDESRIAYPNERESMYVDKQEQLVRQTGLVGQAKLFRLGRSDKYVRVYEVKTTRPYIYRINDALQDISPYAWNNGDTAFENYGPYFSSLKNEAPGYSWFYYPFRSLFTGRRNTEKEFSLDEDGNYYWFTASLPESVKNGILTINDFDVSFYENEEGTLSGELVLQNGPITSVTLGEQSIVTNEPLRIHLTSSDTFSVGTPKQKGLYSYANDELPKPEVKDCDSVTGGRDRYSVRMVAGEKIQRLDNTLSSTCIDYYLSKLPNKYGYIVAVDHKNIEGELVLVQIINGNSRREDIAVRLENTDKKFLDGFYRSYILIPPMEQYGLGYSIRIANASIGEESAVNEIKNISLYPIPYKLLTSLVVKSKSQLTQRASLLVLDESYHEGWKAYIMTNYQFPTLNLLVNTFPFLFGEELTDHVLVNNWANGWVLDDKQSASTIKIVYWPQYLQYAGFALLVLGILTIVLYPKDKNSR